MTMYEKIQSLCKSRGFEISNLGGALGISLSKSTISKWKTGAMPRAATLKRIAEFFDVPVTFLTDDSEEGAPQIPSKTKDYSDVVIYNRNGKTETRRFTKEQMEVLYSMMDLINNGTGGQGQ